METTQQDSTQETRDEKGRFLKGVSGNPSGSLKGKNKALFEIEEAIEEFQKEKGMSYWKSATLIAIKLAHEGNTALLCKILDKFVSSKMTHEVEGNFGDRLQFIQFGTFNKLNPQQEIPRGDASGAEKGS